jgi:hypothetical protein
MSSSAMTEMVKESRMGALGSIDTTREIRQIDLSDFEHRKAEIADQLWACLLYTSDAADEMD